MSSKKKIPSKEIQNKRLVEGSIYIRNGIIESTEGRFIDYDDTITVISKYMGEDLFLTLLFINGEGDVIKKGQGRLKYFPFPIRCALVTTDEKKWSEDNAFGLHVKEKPIEKIVEVEVVKYKERIVEVPQPVIRKEVYHKTSTHYSFYDETTIDKWYNTYCNKLGRRHYKEHNEVEVDILKIELDDNTGKR